MINVACVLRQGGKVKYDATWVEKLQNGVKQHLSIPHRFICFSDCDVPCDRIPLLPGDPGYWSKIQMFQPNVLSGPTMYIDLDTVVCGNLDDIYHAVKNQTFVMWCEPDKNIHSSAFMFWQGDHSYLWSIYKSQPCEFWDNLYGSPPLYGDQALISEHTKHTILTDYCSQDWTYIANAKNYNKYPEDVRLLMFRKASQKPSTMSEHPLVKQYWI